MRRADSTDWAILAGVVALCGLLTMILGAASGEWSMARVGAWGLLAGMCGFGLVVLYLPGGRRPRRRRLRW